MSRPGTQTRQSPGDDATDGPGQREDSDILGDADVASRVVKGGIQRAGGFVALNLITAGAAVLLLRYLGVDRYGRYGTVMALLAIVQGVTDAGLSLTGSRELSVRRTDAERREVLSHLIGLRIILSAVGLVLAVGFAAAAGYSRVMVEGTAVAGTGILVLSIQSSVLLPLTVELQNWRLALNDFLRQVVLVACFVAFVLAHGSLLSIFLAQLIAGLAMLVLTPALVGRHRLVRPRWTRSEMRALTGRTLPLAISGALIAMYFRVIVILISLLDHSARQIGYYVTSERIIELFLNLPTILIAVVIPVITISARDNHARLGYVTLRMTQMMAVVGVLLAVVLHTGARPILLVLGGHQYLGAGTVLEIQCFALITVFITSAWMTTLIGMRRTRLLITTTAVGVIAVLGCGFALIPPFGANGGAYAAVAADVIFCIAMYGALVRAGLRSQLAAGPLLRIAAAAIPAFALGALSPLPAIVNCLLATALYLLLVVVLRGLPPELESRLRGLVRRPA